MNRTMRDLRPGERGVVEGIALTPDMRQRIQELGIIGGTPVECVGRSPLGDPAAYRIRGIRIALRDSDASRITLRR